VSGNPGGRKRTLVEIEAMLDAEHRNAEKLRPIYDKLRELALGWKEPVWYRGEIVGHVIKHDAAYIDLYLNRVQGPVEKLKADLSDAPDDVVSWLAEHLN
jgi:hypothetical protein